ncbi:MAG: hypothetical protein LUC93_05305 [Planctomycetaceae bacterium]|nr:hypothetical protein [Planctomycetaceae bacterium]
MSKEKKECGAHLIHKDAAFDAIYGAFGTGMVHAQAIEELYVEQREPAQAPDLVFSDYTVWLGVGV